MRLLFINPPWASVYGTFIEAAKRAISYPHLGLCYLASSLEKAGHNVNIIDAEGISMSKLETMVSNHNPDIIGLTCTLPTFHIIKKIAIQLKKIKDVPIIIGGPHVTIMPTESMNECLAFDYCIRGEGEKILVNLVNAIESHQSVEKINGIAYRDKNTGEIILTDPENLNDDLDKLPFPNRKHLDSTRYTIGVPGKGTIKITTIMATRGCPYRCVFCPETAYLGSPLRLRSAKNVVDEMELVLNELDIRHFYFVDLTLTINHVLISEVCELILTRRLDVTWEGHTRVDTIDQNLLRLMKKAGLVRLSFGIESGSPEILKQIKKDISLTQIEIAFKTAKDVGLETRASAIIGHPYETKKSAVETINFLKKLKTCDQLYLHINVPYPGTELYNMAISEKAGLKLLSKDFSEYIHYGNSVLEVNDLSKQDIIDLQKKGFLRFYLTPRRILYNLLRAGLSTGIKDGLAFFKSVVIN